MNRKWVLGVMAGLFLPIAAQAGNGWGLVEIEHVGGIGTGRLVFFFTQNRENVPSCNSYRKRWVLDLNTVSGKEQYALLLTAQAAGKSVRIGGAGSCLVHGDSETVGWVGYDVDYGLHP